MSLRSHALLIGIGDGPATSGAKPTMPPLSPASRLNGQIGTDQRLIQFSHGADGHIAPPIQ